MQLTSVSLVALVVGVLGVWRITPLLSVENGPGDLFVRLRLFLGRGLVGQAIECFDCLSLWVAIPFALALGASWLDRLLWWPALSGGAMVISRAVSRSTPDPVALYVEDPQEETPHVQLRQRAEQSSRNDDDRRTGEGDGTAGDTDTTVAVRIHR
jgi:hypothetical protein